MAFRAWKPTMPRVEEPYGAEERCVRFGNYSSQTPPEVDVSSFRACWQSYEVDYQSGRLAS
jgi:hypothetical protein